MFRFEPLRVHTPHRCSAWESAQCGPPVAGQGGRDRNRRLPRPRLNAHAELETDPSPGQVIQRRLGHGTMAIQRCWASSKPPCETKAHSQRLAPASSPPLPRAQLRTLARARGANHPAAARAKWLQFMVRCSQLQTWVHEEAWVVTHDGAVYLGQGPA